MYPNFNVCGDTVVLVIGLVDLALYDNSYLHPFHLQRVQHLEAGDESKLLELF